MRLSGFNIYVEGFPEAGEALVHNTFTGAYVVIDAPSLAALRKADRGEPLTAAEQAVAADPDFFDPDVGLCVESREAEELEFRRWFEARRSGTGRLDVMVGINLACNFDCPYCSQAQVMDGKVMDLETCDATAAWIAGRARDIGAEVIALTFVGGEPLLHPARIERIVAAVKAEVEAAVGFSLITNGYFLDRQMVDRLVAQGLKSAQITFDGDERTHHLTRVSKKGENTFRRIFDNTIYASRHLRVSINGNYQENTIHGFAPLVDQLAAAGLAPESRIRFGPALEGLSSDSGVGSGSCTFSGSDTRYQIAFHDHIVRAGFDTVELHAVGPCSFHERHSYTIDVDGTILSCPGFLGRRDWGIGHVGAGLSERYEQLLEVNAQRACTGCEHRPNCGGGCVAAEWLAIGRAEGVNCEKDFFDSVIEGSVVREYARATGGELPEPAELPREPGVRPAALRVLM